MKGFTEITDKYRKKHYPDGFFAAMAKNSGGIILIVCGLVLAMLGVFSAILPVNYLTSVVQGTVEYSMDASVVIFFIVVALIFLAGGGFVIWLGVKRKLMGKRQWVEKCAKISDYPESVLQDFESQLTRTDAVAFQLDPQTGYGKGVLTTDYIIWDNPVNPCLIKVSDIVCVYRASLSYTYYVGNRARKGYNLHLVIFSNHKTIINLQTTQERAVHLTSLLMNKNPNIDTAGGIVLTEDQYDTMIEKMKS